VDAYVFNPTGALKGSGQLAAATATLTSDATIPTNNDTVTIGAVTYTFKTALSGGGTVANEVLLGANAAAALTNLKAAINLTAGAGTTYGSGTVIHPTVVAGTLTATTLLLTAITAGTGGNSLVSTETSTHLSFAGGTFSGGVNDNVSLANGGAALCASISAADLQALVGGGCIACKGDDTYAITRLFSKFRFKLLGYV